MTWGEEGRSGRSSMNAVGVRMLGNMGRYRLDRSEESGNVRTLDAMRSQAITAGRFERCGRSTIAAASGVVAATRVNAADVPRCVVMQASGRGPHERRRGANSGASSNRWRRFGAAGSGGGALARQRRMHRMWTDMYEIGHAWPKRVPITITERGSDRRELIRQASPAPDHCGDSRTRAWRPLCTER